MTSPTARITVCICTFRRPPLLRRLLHELERQETCGLFELSIVVADNDAAGSARQVTLDFAAASSIPTAYCLEPRQNIALARNKAVAEADGDLVAFIDDDEYPETDWLASLYRSCRESGAAGVLGPVVPRFEVEPPEWISKGRFFERPTHPTGWRVGLKEARTGNVLLDGRLFAGKEPPFRAQFGTGSEDVDFFSRQMAQGATFIWCNEAVVYEVVTRERLTARYLLRRSLLNGSNSFKYRGGRVGNLAKACVAIPLYAAALPFLLLAGRHHFMKYLLKCCDHGGRLMAFVGIVPFKKYG